MRRSLLLFFAIVLAFWGSVCTTRAQEDTLPEPEHRTWRDTATGRLYWNKHLPVYLYISPTPDGQNTHKLESESMPRYAAPFYFDTEGRNFLRTRWAVDPDTRKTIMPKKEILWEVYADGLPPQTQITFRDAKGVLNTKRYLGVGASFSLRSKDAVSGVEKIFYSVDGDAFKAYDDVLLLTGEGQKEIRYFAEDRVGNRETMHTTTVNIDVTPPTTRSEVIGIVLGNDNTLNTTSQIQLTASDALSGIRATYYRIDSTSRWKPYTAQTKIGMRNIADGNHTLEFYSEDKLGNKEEVKRWNFYLDITPPITISDVLGDKFLVNDTLYFSSRTKMKITAVDNHSGVKEIRYSVDGGPFEVYDTPFYMPNVQGWHTVKYYSVDSTDNTTTSITGAGLYEYRMKIDKVFVDLTGPTIDYKIKGKSFTRNDTTFIASSSAIILSGYDKESGLNHLAYAIDRDPWEKLYEAPFTLEGLASGEHEIEYFGYDNVGNRNVKSFPVIIDSDAPKAAYHLSVQPYKDEKDENGNPIYPLDATVYLSAQDNMTGVARLQYSLNGKPLVDYKQPFRGLERGKNRLKIIVTDCVGNQREYLEVFEVR